MKNWNIEQPETVELKIIAKWQYKSLSRRKAFSARYDNVKSIKNN